MYAKFWFPMKLHKSAMSLLIYETEGVNSEPFHHAVTARYSPITHQPHDHVGKFRCIYNKIPKGVMGCRSLGHLIVLFGLDGVDNIWKLHSILNKKYRHIVCH